MDSLLYPYLESTEESEREELLQELLEVHAAPIIRRTLKRELGFFLNQFGVNPNNPDAEDIYQDACRRGLSKLNAVKSRPSEIEIRDYRKYVERVAVNACGNYSHQRSPGRRRLKNRVRYLLNQHPGFELRQGEGKAYRC